MILPLKLVFHSPLPSCHSSNIFWGHADAGHWGECLWYRVTLHGRYYVKFGHRNSSFKPSATTIFKHIPFTCLMWTVVSEVDTVRQYVFSVVSESVSKCGCRAYLQWRRHFPVGTFNFRSGGAAEAGVFCWRCSASTTHFKTIIHNAAAVTAAAAAASINPS